MASLRVVYIMDFIEDDIFDVLNVIRIIVEHGLKHFGSHDHATGVSVKSDISCQDTNITELEFEVAVLLVG